MKHVYYCAGMFILFLIQAMCGTFYFDIKPNFLLIFALCLAVTDSLNVGLVYGIISGFLLDVSGSITFGSNILLMMYFVLLCGIVFSVYFTPNYFAGVIFVSLGTLVYELIFYLFNFTIWGKGDFLYALQKLIIPEFLYNILFVLLILGFIMKVCKKYTTAPKNFL